MMASVAPSSLEELERRPSAVGDANGEFTGHAYVEVHGDTVQAYEAFKVRAALLPSLLGPATVGAHFVVLLGSDEDEDEGSAQTVALRSTAAISAFPRKLRWHTLQF